jgi:hypothetical protein
MKGSADDEGGGKSGKPMAGFPLSHRHEETLRRYPSEPVFRAHPALASISDFQTHL